MATYSPLRLRRKVAQQAEVKKRLILFRLQAETFALALDDVVKVTKLECLYGDDAGKGLLYTTYQGQEIPAIDVSQTIFGQSPTILSGLDRRSNGLPSAPAIEPSLDEVKYAIVLRRDLTDRLIGLPIDSQPSIQSMAMSSFTQMLSIDVLAEQLTNIRCVRLRSQLENRSSIYLLDTSLLLGLLP